VPGTGPDEGLRVSDLKLAVCPSPAPPAPARKSAGSTRFAAPGQPGARTETPFRDLLARLAGRNAKQGHGDDEAREPASRTVRDPGAEAAPGPAVAILVPAIALPVAMGLEAVVGPGVPAPGTGGLDGAGETSEVALEPEGALESAPPNGTGLDGPVLAAAASWHASVPPTIPPSGERPNHADAEASPGPARSAQAVAGDGTTPAAADPSSCPVDPEAVRTKAIPELRLVVEGVTGRSPV
jgi:hypothetical protein